MDLDLVDFQALRLAIDDLAKTFPSEYGGHAEFLRDLKIREARMTQVKDALSQGDETALDEAARIVALHRRILLSNPIDGFR